jgi:hypothetical protein
MQQLGQAGAGQQTYEQNILNAIQQGNQLQTQYPWQQLQNATGIFGALTATPGQPGAPLLTSPGLIGAQAAASFLSPFGTSTVGNGVNALGTLAGSAGNGILGTIGQVGGAINGIGNIISTGGGILDTIGGFFG